MTFNLNEPPTITQHIDKVRRVSEGTLICGALAMLEIGLRWLHDRPQYIGVCFSCYYSDYKHHPACRYHESNAETTPLPPHHQ